MDKDKLSYLANLATVREYLVQLGSVSRNIIDQKTLHSVQSKITLLDRLAVDILINDKLVPESKQSVVKITDKEDVEFASIAKRIQEEKEVLSLKKSNETDKITTDDENVESSIRQQKVGRPSFKKK